MLAKLRAQKTNVYQFRGRLLGRNLQSATAAKKLRYRMRNVDLPPVVVSMKVRLGAVNASGVFLSGPAETPSHGPQLGN